MPPRPSASLPFAFLLLTSPASALQFPDTAALLKEWRLTARSGGKPAVFHRVTDGDSASLALAWNGSRLIEARYENGKGFDGRFDDMANEYGAGGTWHELDELTHARSAARKLYPGLQQQWVLKGYGPEAGWVGSGLLKTRYFLVFRETAPGALPEASGPLRLKSAWVKELDTSSQWLRIPCRADSGAAAAPAKPARGKGKADPVCYSPGENPRFHVRILRKAPLSVEIWLEEEEAESLREIRRAVQTVSDAAQGDYSQDLSQILLGEGQMALVKLAQRAPGLFSWPSWRLQEWKGGKVPPERYLAIIRSEKEPEEFLPALRHEDKAMRLSLDLYYRGAYHLKAEALK